MCKNSQGSLTDGNHGCEATGTNHHGLVAVYVDNTNKADWPQEKKTGGKAPKGAENVAKNIIALTKDEKTKVVEHLAKSIEGGEVVEIRSVSSTSVMVLRHEHC